MSRLENQDKLLSALQEHTNAAIQRALAEHRRELLTEIRQILAEQFSRNAAAPGSTSAVAVNRLGKISEDHLMIIAAVLACHFGKRVKVRSARRIMLGGSSNVWSQQGRAAVQASHSVLR
jgi:hypothetical protein